MFVVDTTQPGELRIETFAPPNEPLGCDIVPFSAANDSVAVDDALFDKIVEVLESQHSKVSSQS